MKRMIGKQVLHYKILAELGRGGMGVVYKAEDTKLKREVAIKFLPRQISANEEEHARFKIEAQAAAALNHPNIATIHAIEEHEDELFIVMEYIEGRELREIITNLAKVLNLRKVLDYAVQIAAGLQAAHEKDVTHRDIKSSNIMITDKGQVKIMDFGLAKIGGGAQLTKSGMTLGTVAYMSPEQMQGMETDHRTDIWAFGVVLYEMLTGELPFKGDYEQAVMYSIMNEEPAGLTDLRDDVPSELSEILGKTLQKEVDNRYQTMTQVLADLESVRTGAQQLSTTEEAERIPAIAVLPFTNLSADPENEYFSDGVAEEIINALAQLPELRVAARTSAFSFKGKDANIRQIGKELNVETVLEGSVRKAGKRLRITAQLINVADGYHLWSERYDRELDDIFAVQDEIATAIAGKLKSTVQIKLFGPLVKRTTHNIEAYELYLKGRHAWARFGTDLYEGLEYFQRAVTVDPEFAPAYAGIADIYATLGFTAAMRPHEAMPKAKDAAERALALDAGLAEAHCARAYVHLLYDWDWPQAEQGFRRSIELNPNYAQAMHHYGHLYHAFISHRLEEGISLCRHAVDIDPLAGYPLHGWLANLYIAGRTSEAIGHLQEALDKDASAFHLRRLLGLCYLHREMFEEARRTMETAVNASGRHTWALHELGMLLARTGHTKEAEAIQSELVARSKSSYVQGTILSGIPAWLGHFDEAFDFLEQAAVERDGVIIAITSWPTLKPLWQQERYDALLKQLGLTNPRAEM
jgi:serine/threonine-protein kinase